MLGGGIGWFAGKQVATRRLLAIVAKLLKVADSVAFVFAGWFPFACSLVFSTVGVDVTCTYILVPTFDTSVCCCPSCVDRGAEFLLFVLEVGASCSLRFLACLLIQVVFALTDWSSF